MTASQGRSTVGRSRCGPGGYLGPETVQSPIVTSQLITQQDKEAREDSRRGRGCPSYPLRGYACRLPQFINCRGQERMKTDKHKCSQGVSLRDWEIAEFDWVYLEMSTLNVFFSFLFCMRQIAMKLNCITPNQVTCIRVGSNIVPCSLMVWC